MSFPFFELTFLFSLSFGDLNDFFFPSPGIYCFLLILGLIKKKTICQDREGKEIEIEDLSKGKESATVNIFFQ